MMAIMYIIFFREDKTSISINTDTINKNDLIVLENGEFFISHFGVNKNQPSGLPEMDLYLKSSSSPNRDHYNLRDNTEVLVIKDYLSGDKIYFQGYFKG